MATLAKILKTSHVQAGLSLEEDGHIVSLMRGEKVLARFSAAGVTIADIHAEADKHTVGGFLDDTGTDPVSVFKDNVFEESADVER